MNATAYAIPAQATVERWVEQTPDGFTFDVKLHRMLSRHSTEPESLPKDLRPDVAVTKRGRVELTRELEQEMAQRTLEGVEPLVEAGKLSSFLLQLSPAFSPRSHELDELAELLDDLAPHPVAVELRHRGWVDRGRLEDTLEWLRDHGAAFVAVDAPQGRSPTMMPAIDAVTRDELAYVRAHGRNAEGYLRGRSVAERFAYRYSDDELREIGQRAATLAEEAQSVRVMFNNNRGDDAPVAAQRLRQLLGQRGACRRRRRRPAAQRTAVHDPGALLAALAAEIRDHAPCPSEPCATCTHFVPGEGNPHADVVLVGEAPGATEDLQGRPFVGRCGRLLDEVLQAAGLLREDVYITNVLKARPPGNRDPRAAEVAHHWPWLAAELAIVAPRLVVPVGRHALRRFVTTVKISDVHGSVLEAGGRTLFPLFHPSAGLRSPQVRRMLLEDARVLGGTVAVLGSPPEPARPASR